MSNYQGKLVSAANKGAIVYLVTAQVNGRPTWYYLKVDALKHSAFKKKMETGKLDVAEYGEVLESGWGNYPPAPIEAQADDPVEAVVGRRDGGENVADVGSLLRPASDG